MAAAQERWEEAVAHWQCACGHARQVQDRAQLATRLVALMEALFHLGRHQEAQAAWQEACTIAEEEGYCYCLLLRRGEEVPGNLAYAAGRWEEAMAHAVESCAWMTRHHVLEYQKAQRRLLERLLALPLTSVPEMAQRVREGWRQRGLAERYPELDQACEEILQLLPDLARGPGQGGGP
ncbi:hypothetical protein [Thermogemmatispora tikiterensis]|uniref:MalT-like TPR region domain-containing protein n=1 Tax=Thermogemmatispora tikiterensis TaxID=1825093 RepID=A0A328VGF7_9CHLR|nr:hypothetical protein [Thermogemmatispora tikiterensis]RAQ95931.1 hypothetical protein A4R35_10330 [Thermogemmatispora tikiterensis]